MRGSLSQWSSRAALTILALLPAGAVAVDAAAPTMSAEDAAIVGVGTADVPIGYVNVKDPWIDRVHNTTFNSLWRSAMHRRSLVRRIRRRAGLHGDARLDRHPRCSGTSSTAFSRACRFAVDMPLPVVERALSRVHRPRESGRVRHRTRARTPAHSHGSTDPPRTTSTLLGIRYRVPKQGSRSKRTRA